MTQQTHNTTNLTKPTKDTPWASLLSIATSPDASDNASIRARTRAIANGRFSCVQWVDECLSRIGQFDDDLRAWVYLDADGAPAQAKSLDDEHKSTRQLRGPLHGVPVGVKDIIDVAGMPTAAGFGPWKNRIATHDAPIVARLREAGAIILGKTVTTQLACFDPPPTRNPWNVARTPGGSSSGSAVAVAAGMCAAALGTQTGGSITRPASYCGVCGLKPTHGSVSMDGIVPVSNTLDHVGPIARCVDDLRLMWHVIQADDTETTSQPWTSSPTLYHFDRAALSHCDMAMRAAFEACLEQLKSRGHVVGSAPWSPPWDAMLAAHRVIMVAEAAQHHGHLLNDHAGDLFCGVTSLIREGQAVTPCDYQAAVALRQELRQDWANNTAKDAFWLTPATPGEPPDTSTTGDPVCNAPWSFLGVPTVSLAMGLSSHGLPMAMQIVAANDNEHRLLEVAAMIESVLRDA